MRLQLLNFYGVRSTAFPVRIESTNVESLGKPAGLLVDCLDNLPAIARVGAALAGIVQEFVELGLKRDVMVARSGITTTSLIDTSPAQEGNWYP